MPLSRKKPESATKPASAMTVREVAEYLNVDEKTIYRMVQRRELPGFKVAGTWRFRRSGIDAWIETSREESSVRFRTASRVRALIVEDDDVDRIEVRRAIREIDAIGAVELVEVTTIAAAKRALVESTWDCVVVDRNLPDGDGLSLIEREGELVGAAAVVVLTGMDDEEGAQAALRQGAQDYLIKGRLDGNALLRSVRYAIERKRFEDQCRVSEANFRGLIEHSPDAICVFHQGHVLYANPAFRALLSYHTLEELIGIEDAVFVHHEDRPRFVAAMAPESPNEHGSQPLFEVRLKSHRGDWVLVEAWTRPVRFDDNDAVLLAGRDVSRRKQLEDQVVFSSRMAGVGTLAAGVAHEINNPLAYMMSNVDFASTELRELISRVPGLAAEMPLQQTLAFQRSVSGILDALKEAAQGASRVKYIVRDLKALARPGSEVDTVVNLRHAVEWSIGVVWNEIRHRARLVKLFKAAPIVIGGEAKLGQIVMNLLVNAAHAISEGHTEANEIRVTIDCTPQGMALLEVTDTGCGIPRDNLQRIFDPVFTTTAIGTGTGHGLAVCHGIVSTLGGAIEVESEMGRGTTFRVLLPMTAKREPQPLDDRNLVSYTGPRGRVLIVDDDTLVATAMARGLSRHHEVFPLSDAREALANLASGLRYDVILCDLMMPQMSGMDFYHELVSRFPTEIDKVVFITGGVFTPHAHDFLGSVPNLRLEKPMDMKMMTALVCDRVTSATHRPRPTEIKG